MANLSSFDLNLLRILDALLQERSTVRAGARIGLSQPAVSAALARLRASLGDELFFRSGRGIEPTQYALSLEPELRILMDRIEALIAGPDVFDPATSTTRFRISGSDFFAELLMPTLADRLQDIAPGVRVHLVDLIPDNYAKTAQQQDVDLALIPETALPGWAESAPVFRSGFLVVARTGHPRLRHAGVQPGDVVPLDLFCDLGHVLFSPEGKDRAMGDAALAQLGRQRRVVMTLPVFSGVYRAVAHSDLIALLPTTLARHVAASEGLDLYQPPMPLTPAQLIMVWHRKLTASPAHVWLRNEIATILQRLDASAAAP